MILNWLVKEYSDLFARDSRVRIALWFDNKAEFRNILPVVEEQLSLDGYVLLAFDKSNNQEALWLKWAIEMGPGAGKKAVLWLPYSREDLTNGASDGTRLDCLLEYLYSGLIWLIDGKPPTLFAFLRKHNVPLPSKRSEQDAIWRGGPSSPLAKYVKMYLNRDDSFWKSRTLSLSLIEESIVGNIEERLLRFLSDPMREWADLIRNGIIDEFKSQVKARYAETGSIATDPQSWAQDFVTSLALLEIFNATDEPNDFPFITKLPPTSFRSALGDLLQRWTRDRDYFEIYQRWALDIDKTHDLSAWARTKRGHPQALRSLAKDRWEQFLEGLREQGNSETTVPLYLNENVASIIEESKGFWSSGTGDLVGWALTADLIGLIDRVNKAVASVKEMKTANEVVLAYVQEWHQIDLTYWKLLSAARKAEDMQLLAHIADRFYERYLDAAGRTFYELFREGGVWPPAGCQGVSALTATLFNKPISNRAILMVDALRFDLAAALRDRMGEGELEDYTTNLPSETLVGMTSLLPKIKANLTIEEGKLQLNSEIAGGDLGYRSNRWKILGASGVSSLGKDKKGKLRDEISHLMELTNSPKTLPTILVLFDRGVDELGHDTGYEVVRHFEELLSELGRAIRRLKAWGYAEIDVVTDHGFILLHSASNVQPIEVDKDRFNILGDRWGFLEPGEKVSTATVPFAFDPS